MRTIKRLLCLITGHPWDDLGVCRRCHARVKDYGHG